MGYDKTILSPTVYIKFREDADEYKELIDKLEPSTFSLLEGFIHRINEDINKNISVWDNLDAYIQEFKLDDLFPSQVLFQLKNPNFLKSLINLKGTKNLLKWALNIFSLDIDFISNPTMFLSDDTLDRDYIRQQEVVNECQLISKVYIDVDKGNYSDEEIDHLQEILIDVRQYLLYVCIYFGAIYLYITAKDEFKTLEELAEELHTVIKQHDEDWLAHFYGELSCGWVFYTSSKKLYGDSKLKYGGDFTSEIYSYNISKKIYSKQDDKRISYGWNKKTYGFCSTVPHNDVKCCESMYPYIYDYCLMELLQSNTDFYDTLKRVTEYLHTLITQKMVETYKFKMYEDLKETIKISYTEDIREWYKTNCNHLYGEDSTKPRGAVYNDGDKYEANKAVYGYCSEDSPYLVDLFNIETTFLFSDVYQYNKTGVLETETTNNFSDDYEYGLSGILVYYINSSFSDDYQYNKSETLSYFMNSPFIENYNYNKSEELKTETTNNFSDDYNYNQTDIFSYQTDSSFIETYDYNKSEELIVDQYDLLPAKFGEGGKYNGSVKQDKFYDPIVYTDSDGKQLKQGDLVFRKTSTKTI